VGAVVLSVMVVKTGEVRVVESIGGSAAGASGKGDVVVMVLSCVTGIMLCAEGGIFIFGNGRGISTVGLRLELPKSDESCSKGLRVEG
jgi:hypothetical protein